MQHRLDALRAATAAAGADVLLVTALHDVRWACGFTGSNALLVVTPGAAYLVTDGRYDAQARAEATGVHVHVPGYDLVGHVADAALVPEGARVAVQAEALSLARMAELRAALPGRAWIDTDGLTAPLVARKEPGEVEKIAAAQRITEAVFEAACAFIRPGQTEQEVAAMLVYEHLSRGCQRMSFDPIVASGPNGALPHARPTGRRLERGDVVVIDMGGVLDGYASDMTRTVALGEPADPDARDVYALVLEAQQAAIRAARPGLTGVDLDAAARTVIAAAGYGPQFAHGLGHGIGLQTHEWPRASYTNPDPLPEGTCVTIEPGIYLEGRFGVRIEDIVHLHGGGCTNLTRADKAFRVL